LQDHRDVTTTPDLIDDLVAGLKPRGRRVERRLLMGAGGGVAVSAAIMAGFLGIRPDIGAAVMGSAFWIKFAYTVLLALILVGAVERLSRPGGLAARQARAVIGVFIAVAILAVAQLVANAPEAWRPLVMGSSALKCPWAIVALAAPILVGTVWAMRGLAPTRLPVAGLAAGLLSGAAGAWIYSFHCDEFAIPFLTSWYPRGIAIVGAAGAGLSRLAWRW